MKKTVILLAACFIGIAPLLAQVSINANNLAPPLKLKLNQIGGDIYKAGKVNHTTMQKWKALVLEIHKKGNCDWNSLIQSIFRRIKFTSAAELYFHTHKYHILNKLKNRVNDHFQYLRGQKARFAKGGPGTVLVKIKNFAYLSTYRKHITTLKFAVLDNSLQGSNQGAKSNLASGDRALIEKAFGMEGSSLSGQSLEDIVSQAFPDKDFPERPTTREELNKLLYDCSDILQILANDAQWVNGEMQKMLKKQQQIIQTMKKVSKALHDIAQDVIRDAGQPN